MIGSFNFAVEENTVICELLTIKGFGDQDTSECIGYHSFITVGVFHIKKQNGLTCTSICQH